METKQHRNIKAYNMKEEKLKEDIIPGTGTTKQQQQQQQQQVLPNTTTSPVPSTSPSSSPSHEFSFTISLHSSSTPLPDNNNNNNKAAKTTPPSFAIDLSPADDIFFHGHLLPLHLLSHLPVSPRTSTNSLDSFTLPIRELLDDKKPNNNSTSSSGSTNIKDSNFIKKNIKINVDETKGNSKPTKSFSLFGWRKGCEIRDKEDKEKQKKKLRFEVSHMLKRYVRMVRPLLFFKGIRRDQNNLQFHRQQPYSLSGNLSWKNNKQQLRGRRGEYSAPASMRTSPTNSGLLVATASIPSSTSDSTMEELQAAIQAAIAHCKNSIATEDNIKC